MLCNIGYISGTHGAFLKFFIDKLSKVTPHIEGSPFETGGTAHSENIMYSGEITRQVFENPDSTWNDSFNWNQNNIIILLDKKALLTFMRLEFTRIDGGGENRTAQVIKINEHKYKGVKLFNDSHGKGIFKIYNIDVNQENIPTIILRDYLKILFLHEQENQFLRSTDKIKKNLNNKSIVLNLSEIYNTEQFLNKMKEISIRFNLNLNLGKEAKLIHKEFLSRIYVGQETLDRADKIIKNIKDNNDTNINCNNLDIVEESYIFAWIEKNNVAIRCPSSENFFKDTAEIKRYIKYYPNHYKTMNTNLPTFQGHDLHNKEK